ncbi:hypothetical protein GCM10011491_37350 [Brucella endophytica]|uniref:Uncharacterized protein n=1 Tax=Brucella endophytica TaxID=1963359 RepID=A0A916WK68_9HYPH|nr:hypothetical protein [Brucella endophytica]GGB05800.1 hypothetical protein GCM10011491_37350 [Brucella endophytica]
MSNKLFAINAPRLVAGLAAIVLTACQNGAQRDPLPYSPNYHMTKADGPVRKGYESQSGRLVPDACVTPDVTEDPLYLPPGCANNMNLQLMVERQSDLLHGRKTGPAMAAPVVRAARHVIDGTKPDQNAAREADVSTTGLQD